MPDAPFIVTTSASLVPEIWQAELLESFVNATKNGTLSVAFQSTRLQDAGGGDILHFPSFPIVATATITDGTAQEYTRVTTSEKTLTVSTQKGNVAAMTDKVRGQSMYDMVAPYRRQAALTMAKDISTALGALYTGAGLSVAGTTTTYITEAQIAEAKEKLDLANCPDNGRWLVVDSKNANAITKITRFSQMDSVGDGSPIRTGRPLGMIHGFTVVLDNNLTAASGKRHCLAGVTGDEYTSSLVYAFTAMKPGISGQPEIIIPQIGAKFTLGRDFKLHSDVIEWHQIYGVAAIRSEFLVDIATAD